MKQHPLSRVITPAQVAWLKRMGHGGIPDLETEWKQAVEEGRQVTRALERRFEQVRAELGRIGSGDASTVDPEVIFRAEQLLDLVQTLPLRKDYPYEEPSSLEEIRRARPRRRVRVPAWTGSRDAYLRHVHGAFLGRIAGCMLGKPVEGWRRTEIEAIARAGDNWPLTDYLAMPPEAAIRGLKRQGLRVFDSYHVRMLRGTMSGAVEDDDINYTVLAFELVRSKGPEFTSLDVAEAWLHQLAAFHTYTAERVAYRNLMSGLPPPESASFRNPYREWIGAQIRADYFGYANPGRPERAAEWAWRDAAVSHVKNGIYGEMWVAAMLAAAFVLRDWREVIRAGLDQIPRHCRLREAVDALLDAHASGATYDDALALIHGRWAEKVGHDWCHTISNAQIVVLGLMWGEDDFGRTITGAVMAGFDTDCNGATCGSLWGAMHGVDAIPSSWVSPLNDLVRTGVAGYMEGSISKLAERMVDAAGKAR